MREHDSTASNCRYHKRPRGIRRLVAWWIDHRVLVPARCYACAWDRMPLVGPAGSAGNSGARSLARGVTLHLAVDDTAWREYIAQRIVSDHRRALLWRNHYRRRAISYGFAPVIEAFTVAQIVATYGDACVYCGQDWAEIDHFIPIMLDGKHTLTNVRPCCKSCNVKRGNPRMLLAIQHAMLTGSPIPTVVELPTFPVPDGRRILLER